MKKYLTMMVVSVVLAISNVAFSGDLIPVYDGNGKVVALMQSNATTNTPRTNTRPASTRCGPDGYVRSAILGGVIGGLLKGNSRGIGKGAGAGMLLNVAGCNLGGLSHRSNSYGSYSSNGGGYYGGDNPGIEGSYLRGVGDRLQQDQRAAESDAYRGGYGYGYSYR